MSGRLSGLRNFRDYGAGLLARGQTIAAGTFFRSGHMSRLNMEGGTALAARGWDLVIDLRYPDERKRDPSPWESEDTVNQLLLPDGSSRAAPHVEAFHAARGDPEKMDAVYCAFYRDLPFDALYRPMFAASLRAIGRSAGPVLVHCSAGKDRTGILVGLQLALLGVDPEAIMADYLTSSAIATPEFLGAMRDQLAEDTGQRLPPSALRAMLAVDRRYLDAALGAMRSRCGSLENYVMESGLTREDLDALEHRALRSHRSPDTLKTGEME